MTEQPDQRTYEAEVYQQARNATGLGDNFFTAPIANATAQQHAARYSETQEQSLVRGQETRGDAPGPSAHYLGYPHQQLYDMVNVDLDAETVDQRGRIVNEMGNWLSAVRAQAARATSTEQASWRGSAAEQAHGFVKGTADWVDGTSQATWLGSNRYSQQAAAASHAKNAMPEPVPFDQAAEMEAARQHFQQSGSISDLTEGARMLEQMEAKQRASQEAHEHAARVLESMDSTYYETASTQPSFAPPPTMSSEQGTSASGFAGTTNVVGGSAPLPPVSAGGVPISGTGAVPTAGSPGHLSSSAPVTGQGPGGGTSGGGGYGTPRTGGGGTIGGALGHSGTGLGRVGSDTTRGTQSRGGSPRSNFAGGRVSGGGYSPGKGGGSAGGSASGRVGGGAPGGKGAADLGAGKSTGTGTTGPKSESIARGGPAASGARTGSTGMPMGAGGRGQKEEDEERKTPEYLQEADPESIFGSRPAEGPDGEKITPPVIGDK